MRHYEKQPRDENGWRVPRDGTMSRRVYDMLKSRTPLAEITAQIGEPAHPYVSNITNPDYKPQTTRLQRMQERVAAKQPAEPAPPMVSSEALIELRLADLERQRAVLIEQQKDARLRKDIEEWIASIGWDRAMKVCRLVWPNEPLYRDDHEQG